MQKTLYICLMTLFFSFSAFADGPFNEYDMGSGSGYSYTSGTTSFITVVSSSGYVHTIPVASPGQVTFTTSNTTTNYYVGTGGNRDQTGFRDAKSILQYQYKSGDVIQVVPLRSESHLGGPDGPVVSSTFVLDSNGNIQHGFIITSNNGSTVPPLNVDYSLIQTNTAMLRNFVSEPSRPNFSYNTYNNNNNTITESIYKATPTGPVLVKTKDLRPYAQIPRIVKANISFAPETPFSIGASIYSSSATSYSLYDGYRVIRDFLDYTKPDDVIQGNNGLGLREKEILEKVLPKIREGLPADLKPDAESILAMYLEQCDENPNVHPAFIMTEFLNMQKVDDVPLPANLPFVDGQNYVFDSEGNPKAAGAAGFLVQIEVNGVKKLPSQLNVNNPAELKALSKVAVCLAKMHGAPVGSWFNTGFKNKPSSDVPAFTQGKKPYMTILNRKGGKFSTDLDNVNSFKNIIQHELGHQYNFKSTNPHIENNLSTHVDVYIEQMETIQFKDSPQDFKLSIVSSLANYIWNMDKKPGITNSLSEIIDKIVTFNSRSAYNGGYRLVAPTDPDNASHIIFEKGKLGTNNTNNLFKVYDPVRNEEVSVIFELNDEK